MNPGEFLRRAIYLLRRKQFSADLEEEMRLHRELRARKYREKGIDAWAAARSAQRRFGNTGAIREESGSMWSGVWFETIAQDIRYALRQFRRAPGFTAIVIATLALGIGANTAIFSIINSVILKPLPYPDSGRLVFVDERVKPESDNWSFSYPDYQDCRKGAHSFTGMAAFRNRGGNLTAPGEPEYVGVREASAGILSVLGVHLALGREFLPEEDEPGARPVVMLSYDEWQKRFGGSNAAVGASVTLDGKSHTVVGILPPGFRFFGDRPVYTPIGQNIRIEMRDRQMHPGIEAVARIAPGVSFAQAAAELSVIGDRVALKYPETNQNKTFGLRSLKEEVVGDTAGTLSLLAGAVGLVLLIACANVANLFLARSASRSRELAVRASIGASRGRIARQMLTESALLGLMGGLAGFVLAALGTRAALSHIPGDLPRIEEIAPDLRVLLFTLLAAVFTSLLFGLAPTLRSRSNLESALRQGSRGTARGLRRIQGGLVIAEIAVALVLLMGAGLMVRTMASLWSVNPGFDPHGVLVMSVALSPQSTSSPTAMRTAWRHIFQRVDAVPGVEAASISTLVPMSGEDSSLGYWTSSSPPPLAKIPSAMMYIPSPDYLKTMKIPLLRGRFFNDHDTLSGDRVIVIDDLLARKAFPGRDPVGARLNLQIIGPVRVVGVVGHVKHWSLDEDAKTATEAFYYPFDQIPDAFMAQTTSGVDLLVRTSTARRSVLDAVKEGVMGPGHDQPVHDVQSMEQMVGDSLARRRLMLFLLSAFASVALLLSAVGIYGVLSYSTGQRIPEIGIRLALGARPRQVLHLILRQGMMLAIAGVLAGAFACIPLTRLISSLLYGIRPADPVTLAVTGFALCAVAFGAVYIPARRASRVDPMSALRQE